MADEIKLSVTMSCANGYFRDSFSPGQLSIDQAAVGAGGAVQIIGTSEEAVVTGDVTTLGYCRLRNLDETNYVEFGPEATGAMVALGKLLPGEIAVFRLKPEVVLRAKANVAPCKLDVKVYEA